MEVVVCSGIDVESYRLYVQFMQSEGATIAQVDKLPGGPECDFDICGHYALQVLCTLGV